MKPDINYSEHYVHDNNADLHLIGWAARKTKKPLEAPGPCSDLRGLRVGESGVASLIWDMPKKGGKASTIEVQMREDGQSEWKFVKNVFTNETTVKHLPRGKVLDFRVIAMNKAGTSSPSNILKVTL